MRRLFSIQWVKNGLDRWMFQLICVLWLLSLADLFFTIWAHHFTPFLELNPAARVLLSNSMLPALILGKLILTTIGCTIFWRLRRRPVTVFAVTGVVVVYFLLAVRWSDYTQAVAAAEFDTSAEVAINDL